MRELLDRQILFVGGKGGVGKSTCAAALAIDAARLGKKCLLVSTDPAHSLGDLFECTIGDRETEIMPGLSAIEIDPEATAERYIESVKRNMRDLVRPALFEAIDRQMDLARLAPGTSESAMLQRMTEFMIEAPESHDLLIFDTAPSGHTLQLLALPEVMESWTEGLLSHRERSEELARAGENLRTRPEDELALLSEPSASRRNRDQRIREILERRCEKFRAARKILLDRRRSGFILVLIPEKLPILESKKYLEILKKHKIHVAALIVNRILPKDITGNFMQQRRLQEARYLEEIRRNFKAVRQHRIPLMPRDVLGRETLEQIGKLLSGGSTGRRPGCNGPVLPDQPN